MIKQAAGGKVIKEDDIPPPVAIPKTASPTPSPSHQPSPSAASSSQQSGSLLTDAPPVATRPSPAPRPTVPKPVQGVPTPQPSNLKADTEMLVQRQHQYKSAALQMKRLGEIDKARQLLTISKVSFLIWQFAYSISY